MGRRFCYHAATDLEIVMGDPAPDTLTERFPILVSGAIGAVFTQAFNVVEQFCSCFTAQQLAALNVFVGTVSAAAAMLWQFRNVWSRASVAKVLDAHSPSLTTAEAKAIAVEGTIPP